VNFSILFYLRLENHFLETIYIKPYYLTGVNINNILLEILITDSFWTIQFDKCSYLYLSHRNTFLFFQKTKYFYYWLILFDKIKTLIIPALISSKKVKVLYPFYIYLIVLIYFISFQYRISFYNTKCRLKEYTYTSN